MSVKIQRPLDRKSWLGFLAGMARFWKRLEYHWEENPGYVFAATAGMFGLILAVSLMLHSGWGNPDDDPDDMSAETAESLANDADDELGEDAPIIARPSKKKVVADDDDDFPAMLLADRQSEPEEPEADDGDDDAVDPFAENNSKRPIVADADDDADDTEEFAPPLRDPADEIGSRPRISIEVVDEEEDNAPEEKLPVQDTQPQIGMESKDQPEDEPAEEIADSDSRAPALLRTNGELESDVDNLQKQLEEEDSISRPKSQPTADPIPETKPEPKKPDPPAETEGWQRPVKVAEPPKPEPVRSEPPQTRAETVVVLPKEKVAARTPSAPRVPTKPNVDLPVQMSITGPGRVDLDQNVEYILSVVNTGRTPLNRLVLSIELPAGLAHEVSQSIEQEIKTVPAGGTHRALLRLKATQPGLNVINADVASGKSVVMRLKGRVQVDSTTASRVVQSTSDSEISR